MSIHEPRIAAECDKCGVFFEDIPLTSLAGGGWDDRNVKSFLTKNGWAIDGEKTICDECCAST